jgi:Bacterial tandem repeat domain 1
VASSACNFDLGDIPLRDSGTRPDRPDAASPGPTGDGGLRGPPEGRDAGPQVDGGSDAQVDGSGGPDGGDSGGASGGQPDGGVDPGPVVNGARGYGGSDWFVQVGLDSASYQGEFPGRIANGYRPFDVSGYAQADGSIRYAVLWKKNDGQTWEATASDRATSRTRRWLCARRAIGPWS